METQGGAGGGGSGGDGGSDEKPPKEGHELSQSVDAIAQNLSANEPQQELPFITPEPLREDQVQNAVNFLSHPKVKGSPVIYRRSFLERKGLTKGEIDEAFRRVPDPPPSATTTDVVPTSLATPSKSSTSIQPQAPVPPLPPTEAQVGAVSLVPTTRTTRFNWSHALIAIGVLSASGAGSALLFKKVVLPRLKAWIRRVAVEDDSSAKEEKASKSLAEETAEAAKAAASAAAIVATASQEFLNSKKEDRKYFEAFMGMIDVQVKEMKSMGEAIHKLEKAREQDKLVEDYAHYATTNGTTNNNPWRNSQVNQADTALSQIKLNGTPNNDYEAGTTNNSWRTSQVNQADTALSQIKLNGTPHNDYEAVPSASEEPLGAPHSKTYMEIMAMVQRGEKPPNIKEVNDMPPNPNQQPSKPLLAPKSKPWEITQQNGKPQDIPSEPWWRKKSVKITELDPEAEEPSKQFPYSTGTSERRAWVPPQPPSVAIPESAAAIRHPKPSPPPLPEQHSGDEKTAPSSPDSNGVANGEPGSGGDVGSLNGDYVVPVSEIEEERSDAVEVI